MEILQYLGAVALLVGAGILMGVASYRRMPETTTQANCYRSTMEDAEF